MNNYPKNDYFDSNTNFWNITSNIGKSYIDAYDKLTASGMDIDSAYELANAYVLGKFDTGMIMSKKRSTDQAFNLLQTIEKDGNYSKTDDCLL